MEKANNENINMVKIPIEDKVESGRKKRPIILSACLIVDILCFLISFSILLLMANNTERLNGSMPSIKAGEKVLAYLRIAMTYGVVSTTFCFVTAMILLIYSLVVLFGDKKYDFLSKHIGKELHDKKKLGLLDSSVNNADIDII